MKVLSKERIIPHENGRPVFPGFVTYVDRARPVLIHRWSRVDYSDAYDDYVDQFSEDNGRTWSAPVPHLKSCNVPEGKMRYIEPAAFFDPDSSSPAEAAELRRAGAAELRRAGTGKLVVLTNKRLYPKDTLDVDIPSQLVLDSYDPRTKKWSDVTPLPVAYPCGLSVSFPRPIKTSRGRLVFPAQGHYLDEKGKPLHYKGCWCPAGVIVHILGDYRSDGTISWHLSRPVIPDLEKTSRGFYEAAVAELTDGRFAMVLRGDNSMYPDRPGYKWLSFSDDHCETWSDPVPLPCTVAQPPSAVMDVQARAPVLQLLESGSNGSALFRSITDGKLYWIGTLCIDGSPRPNANWPRQPLLIAEVQESPFAIKRDTITVIDRRQTGEPEQVQLSNFRFYQDRETGDVVLFLTRYGERSAKQWMLADYYRYRVEMA